VTDRRSAIEAAYAALNRSDLDGFCQVLDPEVITVNTALGNPVGTAAVIEVHWRLLVALPDLRYRIEEVLEAGATTVTRVTAFGTPAGNGDFGTTSIALCVIAEWVDDHIVTVQTYWDSFPGLGSVRTFETLGRDRDAHPKGWRPEVVDGANQA